MHPDITKKYRYAACQRALEIEPNLYQEVSVNVRARDDYQIAWICTVPAATDAAKAMLDETHHSVPRRQGDANEYIFGRMGRYNVVITSFPPGLSGLTIATETAMHIRYSFRFIEVCFLVSVGGGTPGESDVRLGDIVVSKPTKKFPGVMGYDIRNVRNGRHSPIGVFNKPPELAMNTVFALHTEQIPHGTSPAVTQFYNEARAHNSRLRDQSNHPGGDSDFLFASESQHASRDSSSRRLNQWRPRSDNQPRIFYGTIASGEKAITDVSARDRFAREYGILCCETQAAGVVDLLPCLVVCGVSSYADSHPSRQWEGYAAVVAAAYAKEIVLALPWQNNVVPGTISRRRGT